MAEYLNTDDLRARLAELHDELAEREEAGEKWADLLPERQERAELEAMESGISDWQYGETLIPEDAFEDYARELAEDIGAIDPKASWPLSYIDWSRAADALRQDYTEFEYQGTTYLVRA